MEKLTFQQIEEIINSELFDENDCEPTKFMFEDVYDNYTQIEDDESNKDFIQEYKRLGTVNMMEHFGGEGSGDLYYTVYHFVDHDVYVNFEGWYASSVGAEYQEMFEVFPEQKTITVYNQK